MAAPRTIREYLAVRRGADPVLDQLMRTIAHHEGMRHMAYDDRTGRTYVHPGPGILTIGKGTRIGGTGITEPEADALMLMRIDTMRDDLRRRAPTPVDDLPPDARLVVWEMCYQLGVSGCLGFRRMWAALAAGDYATAAHEMRESDWARIQTPERAHTLAARMATAAA